MLPADDMPPQSLTRQFMKLSKPQLVKQCKQYKVSYIGTKSEMSLRIVTKIQHKKKKKLNKTSKKRKKSKHKNQRNKENKNININTEKKQLSLKLFQTSPSTKNVYFNFVEGIEKFRENIICSSLQQRGYKEIEKIRPTLEGKVFIASKTLLHRDCITIYGFIRDIINNAITNDIYNNYKEIIEICYMYYKQKVVIKSANKCYYTSCDNKTKENIINEAYLMSIFMNNDPPKEMIKFYDFFQDKNNYYLIMEKAEKSLFEFNVDAHNFIINRKMDISQWREIVKCIFFKMVKFVHWLHNNLNCCHLDISLENIIISNNNMYFDEDIGKYNTNDINIKFIDFGLTEIFNNSNNNDTDNNDSFLCDKYVGKLGYQSPKIYDKKPFMANKADIYSLGICLFLLSFGAPPYVKPNEKDQRFQMIKDGKLKELIKCWNRLDYADNDQFDLLMGMMQIDEMKRFSVDTAINHIWLKSLHQISPSIVESNTSQCQNDDYFAAVDDMKK